MISRCNTESLQCNIFPDFPCATPRMKRVAFGDQGLGLGMRICVLLLYAPLSLAQTSLAASLQMACRSGICFQLSSVLHLSLCTGCANFVSKVPSRGSFILPYFHRAKGKQTCVADRAGEKLSLSYGIASQRTRQAWRTSLHELRVE